MSPVRGSRRLLVALAVLASGALLALTPANAAPQGRYVGGGVAVVRAPGGNAADDGVVVCDAGDGVGAGGLCLPFGTPSDAVHVMDDNAGEDVAFQVCVDNNGDGVCSSPDPDPVCGDVIAFSHDDAGAFYNPVGPLPGGFKPGCPGGEWRGYVVLLCQGVHAVSGAHAHPAGTGTGTLTTGGEGLGTFCGGNGIVSRKPYRVADPGGDLTCGLNASTDPGTEVPPGNVTGILYGGPWRSVQSPGLTIRCGIQVDGLLAAQVVSSSTGQAAVQPPFVVSFPAPPSSEVRVCTQVDWTDAAGSHVFQYDIDPTTPGVQCPLATRVYVPPPAEFQSLTVEQSSV